jgi:hypothetical protein
MTRKTTRKLKWTPNNQSPIFLSSCSGALSLKLLTGRIQRDSVNHETSNSNWPICSFERKSLGTTFALALALRQKDWTLHPCTQTIKRERKENAVHTAEWNTYVALRSTHAVHFIILIHLDDGRSGLEALKCRPRSGTERERVCAPLSYGLWKPEKKEFK